MIAIQRSPEPHGLSAIRTTKLAAARIAKVSGKVDFGGYDVVKPDLAKMQHNKCCYCEKKQEQSKYRDVEHFRPKSAYWWLTWTWENLLFACIDCNRESKRDQFPLAAGGTHLKAEDPAPGLELPLLLDPASAVGTPVDHIEFRREKLNRKERWIPRPRGGSTLGSETIRVCRLDRPGLLDLYSAHVQDFVRPKLELLNMLQPASPTFAADVVRLWGRACRGAMANGQAFRALSYDSFLALTPLSFRQKFNLTIARP